MSKFYPNDYAAIISESIGSIASNVELSQGVFEEILSRTLAAFPTGGDPNSVRSHVDGLIRAAIAGDLPLDQVEYQSPGPEIVTISFPTFFDLNGLHPGVGITQGPNTTDKAHFHVLGNAGAQSHVDASGDNAECEVHSGDTNQIAAIEVTNTFSEVRATSSSGAIAKMRSEPGSAEAFFVITSADGNVWKITVSNGGAFVIAPYVP